MSSTTTKRELQATGATADYTVALIGDGPLIAVSATAKQPVPAQQTAIAVVRKMQQQIAALQLAQGAALNTQITVLPLSGTPDASPLRGSQTRAMLGVVALGVTAAIWLTFLTESIFERRRIQSERRRIQTKKIHSTAG